MDGGVLWSLKRFLEDFGVLFIGAVFDLSREENFYLSGSVVTAFGEKLG